MSDSVTRAGKPGKKRYNWKHYIPYYVMVLPGLIYLLFNNYMPMFGVIIAFKNLDFSKGIFGSDWCGFPLPVRHEGRLDDHAEYGGLQYRIFPRGNGAGDHTCDLLK